MPRARAMYFPAGAGQPVIRRGTLAGVGNSGKMRNARGVHVPVVMAASFRFYLMSGKGPALCQCGIG